MRAAPTVALGLTLATACAPDGRDLALRALRAQVEALQAQHARLDARVAAMTHELGAYTAPAAAAARAGADAEGGSAGVDARFGDAGGAGGADGRSGAMGSAGGADGRSGASSGYGGADGRAGASSGSSGSDGGSGVARGADGLDGRSGALGAPCASDGRCGGSDGRCGRSDGRSCGADGRSGVARVAAGPGAVVPRSLQVVRVQPDAATAEAAREAAAWDAAEARAQARPPKLLRLESEWGSPAGDSRRLYERGLAAYQRGDCHAATDDFAAVVRHHSDAPEADGALFWMGECKLEAGDYRAAIAIFTRLRARGTGPRAAEALLKIGLAQRRLGARAAARASLAQVIAEYPDSAEADLARQRLAAGDDEGSRGH